MYLFHSLGIASSQVSVSVSCLVMPYCLQPHGLQPTSLLCPWDFSRQGYWSGLPFPSPGDLPNPGIEPRSPALQADSLPTELQGKPSDCANTSDNRTNYCTMLIFLFFKKAFIYLLSLWFFFSTTCLSNDWHIYFSNDQSILPPYPQISFQKSTAFLFQWRWAPLWTCYSVVILGQSLISRVRAPFLCPVTFCLVCCFIFPMAYVPVVAQEWVQKVKLIQLSFFSQLFLLKEFDQVSNSKLKFFVHKNFSFIF